MAVETRSSVCAVDECDNPRAARDWCSKHYARWRKYGDTSVRVRLDHAGAVCAVPGCTTKRRKLSWCGSHYSQMRKTGKPPEPFGYKWPADKRCIICGAIGWKGKGRKSCSPACSQMIHRWGDSRPESVPCARCGVGIDLTARTPSGRRRRGDTKLCFHCATRTRAPMSASELAARDGAHCALCLDPVDMALRAPDLMRPSIDHRIPRARGGSNAPENLQLTHLACNQKKHTSDNESAIVALRSVA